MEATRPFQIFRDDRERERGRGGEGYAMRSHSLRGERRRRHRRRRIVNALVTGSNVMVIIEVAATAHIHIGSLEFEVEFTAQRPLQPPISISDF